MAGCIPWWFTSRKPVHVRLVTYIRQKNGNAFSRVYLFVFHKIIQRAAGWSTAHKIIKLSGMSNVTISALLLLLLQSTTTTTTIPPPLLLAVVLYPYLSSVVHAGAQVIRYVKCNNLGPGACLEVVQFALRNVVLVNDDVDVPIRSTLLVPETHCVTNLVRYRTVLYTTYTAIFIALRAVKDLKPGPKTVLPPSEHK